MNMHEKAPEERSNVTYGRTRKPYTTERCAAKVWSGFSYDQCARKPGHGAGALYCKQHAKQYPDMDKTEPVSGFFVYFNLREIRPFSGVRTEDGIVRNSKGFKVNEFIYPTWVEAHNALVNELRQKFENALSALDRAQAAYNKALDMKEPTHGA